MDYHPATVLTDAYPIGKFSLKFLGFWNKLLHRKSPSILQAKTIIRCPQFFLELACRVLPWGHCKSQRFWCMCMTPWKNIATVLLDCKSKCFFKPCFEKKNYEHGIKTNRLTWHIQTLVEAATDFGKISDRLWENQRPPLGKSETDFGKISHGLWENELRRHMEIRNKLFQKISSNKIT